MWKQPRRRCSGPKITPTRALWAGPHDHPLHYAGILAGSTSLRGAALGHDHVLFLLRRGGEAVKASEEPLADSVDVHDGDRMALCVAADAGALDECFVLRDSICFFAFPPPCVLEWEWDAF